MSLKSAMLAPIVLYIAGGVFLDDITFVNGTGRQFGGYINGIVYLLGGNSDRGSQPYNWEFNLKSKQYIINPIYSSLSINRTRYYIYI